MQKIAIFLSDLYGGGAERVMLNLANGLVAHNLDVDLILVRKFGQYISQIDPKVRVVDLQGKSLIRSLPLLMGYLKQEQPSVLLSALEDTNIVAILAKTLAGTKIKTIVSVHNVLSQESSHADNLKRKFIPYLLRWFYLGADTVVAVSQGVARDLVKLGVAKDKISVIYNPIVTPDLEKKLQQSLEHPWFTPEQSPVILAVGRLNQQKSFSTLIKAFTEVRKSIPARLMILGEGEQRDEMELLVTKLGVAEDVSLPGFVDNPYIYMKKSKLLVLSSAWEGFGNVLVEAMVAGTPVVSTDCLSGPAEILADGKYGKLVPVGDVDCMARAIIESLQTTPNREIIKLRAMEFSLERSMTDYLNLFTN
jgi:glycosyltransferase involved in cell wall biosynthesis